MAYALSFFQERGLGNRRLNYVILIMNQTWSLHVSNAYSQFFFLVYSWLTKRSLFQVEHLRFRVCLLILLSVITSKGGGWIWVRSIIEALDVIYSSNIILKENGNGPKWQIEHSSPKIQLKTHALHIHTHKNTSVLGLENNSIVRR